MKNPFTFYILNFKFYIADTFYILNFKFSIQLKCSPKT